MSETVAIDELKDFSVKMDEEQTVTSTIQGPETTNFTEVC